MSNSWALITGGSHSEIPLVKAARRLGHRVATLGADARGAAHQISDKAIIRDFSAPRNITDAMSDLEPAAVIPGCNDYSYLACAQALAEAGKTSYGFDSPEIATKLHHKDRFRQLQVEVNLPRIKSMIIGDQSHGELELSELQFPLIVKPVDLSGGKGIKKVTDPAGLQIALKWAFKDTRAQRVLVEEYLAGSHHSLFLLQVNGEARFTYFADEYFCEHAPFLVCGAYTTTGLPASVQQSVIDDTLKIARVMPLVDGLIHIQFVWNEGSKPVIIEATRRPPGDLYLELVERCSDLCVLNTLIGFHGGKLGEPLDSFVCNQSKVGRVLRHCIWADSNDTLGVDLHSTDTSLATTGARGNLEKRAIIFRNFDTLPDIPGR